MTDRLRGVIVTFEHDIRVDDAEPLIDAIKMLKGVLSVKPVVTDIQDHIAQERARHDLGQKLWKVIYPDPKRPE